MNPYAQQDYYQNPLNKAANDVYSLFLIGAVIGWLTIPVGSLMAAVYYRRTTLPLYRSHFKYQAVSSVWLFVMFGIFVGCLYYFLIAPTAAVNQVRNPLTNSYRAEITAVFVFWFAALYILWIRRFWVGYRLLNAKKAIRNPLTLWIPRAGEEETESNSTGSNAQTAPPPQ